MSPSETNTEERMATSQPDTPFDTTADITVTRSERYRALFEEIVVAPMKILVNDYRALIGFAIVSMFVLAGTIGVMVIDVPRTGDGANLLPPFQTMAFPLGTTVTGKGVFAQLVHATPSMLKMIAAGSLFSTVMATIWGAIAGYKGGTVDQVMMTIADIVITIPGLPLVVVLAAFFQPENPYTIGLILGIHAWGGFARSLRAQVLTIRRESYVESSRTMGISTTAIVFKDVLPNVMSLIAVRFANGARNIIFASVGLYYIGVLPFSGFNWGVMMQQAYKNDALIDMELAHWFIAPMITIVVFSLGLILLSQGVDRIFNPRIRAKHATHTDEDETDITAPTEGGL